MKIKFFIFLFLFSAMKGKINFDSFAADIINNLFQYVNITEMLNSSLAGILEEKNASSCLSQLLQIVSHNENDLVNYGQVFSYSGKGLSDFGNEIECNIGAIPTNDYDTNVKLEYFAAQYNFTDFEKAIDEEASEVMNFLNQTTYYTGFCVMEGCISLIKRAAKDKFITSFLEEKFKVSGLEIIHLDENETNIWVVIFLIIFAIYCVVKVLVTIIRVIFFYEGYYKANLSLEIKKKENAKELKIKDENELLENIPIKNEENRLSEKQNNFTEFSNRPTIDSHNEDEDIEDTDENFSKLPIRYKFLKILDIIDNLSQIFKKKSTLFNDKKLELLVIFRVIVGIGIIYSENMRSLLNVPGRNFLNRDFYKNFLFLFIKLSTYSVVCWVIIDAAIFTFKFMTFLKKRANDGINNENPASFKNVSRFFLKCFPRFILFWLFYFVYSCSKWLLFLFPTSTIAYKIINDNIERDDEMSEYLSSSLIFYDYWLKYMDILSNEFIFFSAFLFYFYIAFKLKSNLLDIILAVLTVPFFIYSYFFIKERTSNEKFYRIKLVLGQDATERYPWFFSIYYLFGVIVGMCYFYHEDNKSKRKMTENKYYPFQFCNYMLKYLNECKILKKFLLILVFLLMVLMGSSFKIFLFFSKKIKDEKELLKYFTGNTLLELLFVYERYIFGLLFSFLLILVRSLFKGYKLSKYSTAYSMILPFSRISTSFFCTYDIIIIFTYCIFVFQIKISYQNFFLFGFGQFMYIWFCSVILTITLEIPLRVLTKFLEKLIF